MGNGKVTQFSRSGESPSIAINERNVIGGSNSIGYSSYTWRYDITTQTKELFGQRYGLWDINDINQAVGNSSGGEAWFWNGQFLRLNSLNDFIARCYSINNKSQIVGIGMRDFDLFGDEAWAVLWEQGETKDINNLIPDDSGWQLNSARAINDAGQIVGYGTFNGEQHAFLLNVVPEPSTIFMFLSGILGFFWTKKQKTR